MSGTKWNGWDRCEVKVLITLDSGQLATQKSGYYLNAIMWPLKRLVPSLPLSLFDIARSTCPRIISLNTPILKDAFLLSKVLPISSVILIEWLRDF